MKSFPNTQGAMSDNKPEVEDDEPEVEVVDMSLEDSLVSPEKAGANARSPSHTPDSPTLDLPALICRYELYETRQEAALLLDAAEEEEGAARILPRYAALGSRSPSLAALASSYTQVRGDSDLPR